MNTVICINRKKGTGGARIGKLVANQLGIAFFGKNLAEMAIEYGGLDHTKYEPMLKKYEETAPNKFTYSLLDIGNSHVTKMAPAEDIIYDLEKEVIIKEAKEKNCVVIGRCGGDILADADVRVIRVFLTASDDYRVKYIFDHSGEEVTEKEARKKMEHDDKQRAQFFKNYTGKEWEDPASYDIVVNVENLGVEETVRLLCGIFHNEYEK